MKTALKTATVIIMSVLIVISSALLVFSQVIISDDNFKNTETETSSQVIESLEPVSTTETVSRDIPVHETFEIVNIKGGDPLCDHYWPTWIETVPPRIGVVGTAISYCSNCKAVQEKKIDALPDPNQRVELDVKNILQNPQLPNGCEIVSLAIVLNYLGFEVDPVELSDKYLEKGEFWIDSPYKKYIGDPKNETGTGCYAPCIIKAANNFLKDQKSELMCVNVSGKDLKELEKYIDDGIPVIIWGTVFMDCDPSICYSYWTQYDGIVTWYMHSHCLVMTGHSASTYVFADPLYGTTDYTKENVEKSYNQEFMQACIIK